MYAHMVMRGSTAKSMGNRSKGTAARDRQKNKGSWPGSREEIGQYGSLIPEQARGCGSRRRGRQSRMSRGIATGLLCGEGRGGERRVEMEPEDKRRLTLAHRQPCCRGSQGLPFRSTVSLSSVLCSLFSRNGRASCCERGDCTAAGNPAGPALGMRSAAASKIHGHDRTPRIRDPRNRSRWSVRHGCHERVRVCMCMCSMYVLLRVHVCVHVGRGRACTCT